MRKIFKVLAILVALNFLFEIFYPTVCYALGGGPSQPEVESFEPSGTTNMVDLFTGDFNYNIPLFDVDGYPINIAYHSGISMDQEASWTGLGWNINPGAITRSVRGIPDDFKGDTIIKDFNIRDNVSYGYNMRAGLEIAGIKKIPFVKASLEAGLGIVYNNYKGLGYEFVVSPGISAGTKNKKLNMNLGCELSVGSQTGASFNRTIAASWTKQNGDNLNTFGLSVSSSFNTRSGLKTLSIGTSYRREKEYVKETDPHKIADKKADAAKHHQTYNNIYTSESFNLGSSSTISYAYPTINPEISMPMKNSIQTLNGTVGYESYTLHPHGGITGYRSVQKLRNTSYGSRGFGYMYEQYGRDDDDNLKDFNREKDVPFNQNVPYLPPASLTYDIYDITGQGVSGMFRPYRNDIGMVFDQHLYNTSSSEYIGVEIGVGDYFRGGANLCFAYSYTQSGKWDGLNLLPSVFRFMGREDFPSTVALKPFYEPCYFKVIGEKHAIDETFYNKLGGEKSVKVALSYNPGYPEGFRYIPLTKFQYGEFDNPTTISPDLYKLPREPRNQVVYPMTVGDLKTLGLNSYEQYNINHHDNYYLDNNSYTSFVHNDGKITYGVNDPVRKDNHIGRITVLAPDGRRYIYGIAAYNVKQKEATFNVDNNGNDGSNFTGLVSYSPGDNSTGNTKGINHYYNSITTPAYAHSYLLTEVLSNDYVDYDNDGKVSTPDLGSAIKFNYSKLKYNYRWRVPFDSYKANYEEGFKSDGYDDKGSYVYGEKEIWYLHSVESKSYVLEFYLSKREDVIGTTGENGGIDTSQRQMKIDSIVLYAKNGRYSHGMLDPIKTVHFEYDYSLCQNVPNNSKSLSTTGKLTLKSLYFTYGLSNKSKINAYHFKYSNTNPDYNLKGYDRWGNYKPNKAASPNFEDPYVSKDKELADSFSQGWSLTSIDLPSGGTIKVTYESDDYSYVQNRQVMTMDNVLGVSGSDRFSANNVLFNKTYTRNNFIFFRLSRPITYGTADQRKKIIKRDYIGKDSLLYFKFMVNLVPGTAMNDFVPGYARIEDYGIAKERGSTLSDTIGYIKIAEFNMYNKGNDKVNAIASASWQFLKYNLPQKIFGDENKEHGTSINSFAKYWNNIKVLFKGYDDFLCEGNFCSTIDLSKSKIRLLCPTMIKFGGGSRVKEISLSDNWTKMGNDRGNRSYGQKYEYTTEVTLSDGSKQTISSGVASYEPMIGNEENPFRRPLGFNKEAELIPDTDILLEEPLGESFFPSPAVGYSRVKVTNLKPSSVHKHATGYTVSQFYTEKDFPTKINPPSTYDIRRDKPEKYSLNTLFNFSYYDYTYASQGYSIELNDMHGKLKSEEIYQQTDNPSVDDQPISSIRYEYYTDENDSTRVGNLVSVIDQNNNISKKYMGKEKDVVADIRDNSTQTYDPSTGMNLDVMEIMSIPIPVFTIWPMLKTENTSFKSITITKVIHKYGILKKTIATDLGSKVSTENILFDGQTGDVLLTKVNNEYNDTLYKFDYPAWWIYNGMGMASVNINGYFENVNFTTGSISSYATMFTPGDEVMMSNLDGSAAYPSKAWVLENRKHQIVFIDKAGRPINLSSVNVRIIRSGCRNILGAKAGSVVTLSKPITGGSLSFNSKILSSDATIYSDQWQTYYHPNRPICDSINLFACNFLQMLNYIWSGHKQKDALTWISKSNVLCNEDTNTLYPYLDSIFKYNDGLLQYNYKIISNDSSAYSGDFGINNNSHNSSFTHEFYNFELRTMDGSKFNWNDPSIQFLDVKLFPEDSDRATNRFIIDVQIGGKIVQLAAYTNFTTINFCRCTDNIYLKENDVANPYLLGVRGNWRPKKQYNYVTGRKQTLDKTHNNRTDIRSDGIYDTYTPFWAYNSSNQKWQLNSNITGWIWTEEMTLWDPHGLDIESRDPLNRYATQIPGLHYTQTVAVAGNTKSNNIFFEGCDGWNYIPGKSSCGTYNLWSGDLDQLAFNYSYLASHTGKWSLQLGSGSSISIIKQVKDTTGFVLDSTTAPNNVYRLLPSDFIYGFMPDHQKYVISAWVYEYGSTNNTYGSYISVIQRNSSGSVIQTDNFYPSGNIIDNWQRISGTFTFKDQAVQIEIKLNAVAVCFFDDIRVHPFNSNMKTFVYDVNTLKLIAELDENNYATFYEYDQEGDLVRIKKETVNGVVTLQESRKSLRK